MRISNGVRWLSWIWASVSVHSLSAAPHSGILSIVSGPNAVQTCALMVDKRLACWGNGSPTALPVDVAGQNVIAASLGYDFGCAIVASGYVYCWGGAMDIPPDTSNSSGQMGDGTTTPRTTAGLVTTYLGAFGPAVAIAAGNEHVCAIDIDSGVWCWGSNEFGQIGNLTVGVGNKAVHPMQVLVRDDSTTPPNPPLLHIKQIVTGLGTSCGLFTDNHAACWGSGWDGELGNGEFHLYSIDSPQTVVVPSDSGTVNLIFGGEQLVAGQYYLCGLVADSPLDSIACWGANGHGQLGDGTTDGRAFAVASNDESGKIKNAFDMAAGYAFSCAILADSTVRCWGSDQELELGATAAGSNSSIGIKIINDDGSALSGMTQLAAGAGHACGLAMDRSVHCWGDNSLGQLGVTTPAKSAYPVKVQIDAPLFYANFDE